MPTRPTSPATLDLNSYGQRSQRPLASLFLLLPQIVVYELGVLLYATDYAQHQTVHILARSYMREVLRFVAEIVGVRSSLVLPGIAVVVFLLVAHLVGRRRWEFEPRLYAVMFGESVLWSLLLLGFWVTVGHRLFAVMALQAPAPAVNWKAGLVLSVGAGIYEELLFRLIAVALLHTLLVNVLALPEFWGTTAAIGVSAIAFAVYHFTGGTPFRVSLFLFYTLAGSYFGLIFCCRGFGIVASTHAMYDVFVVLLREIGPYR